MADMKQTTATKNEVTTEQLMEVTKQIALNQKNISEILSELIKCVVAYRHDELDTIYGLFPQLDLIKDMAENEADYRELLRQYGNGGKILRTEHISLNMEVDV